MSDAIAVVNAGSSSIKFSLFAEADSGLEFKARGQVEGISGETMYVDGGVNIMA